MKHYIALAALALSLGGCASTGTNTLPATITSIEQEIQADAQSICSFVPTAATVAQIIASLFPGASAVEAIAAPVAQQICSAVSASPALTSKKFGAAPVYYPNTTIPIHGTFVKSSKKYH